MWCMRLSEGPLSEAERAELTAWIETPANAEAFHDQASLWGVTEAAATAPEMIRMRGEALDSYRRGHADRWRGQARARPRWVLAGLAAAASVVIAVGAMTLVRFTDLPVSGSADDRAARAVDYRTGTAERSVAVLEDGSRLTLDADSAVSVRITDARRDVKVLQGRAGFEVAKNGRPFAVTAGDKTVVATGTRFSVELLGKATNVALYEGSVDVLGARAGGARKITAMKPGSALTLPAFGDVDSAPPRIQSARAPLWEAGQLEFVDEPLPEVVARFNRYAARPLVIGAGVPADIRITGVFEANDAAAFAQGVAALHGLTVSRGDRETVLSAGSGAAR
nr:FecR domain-containing protein [Sphingomonas colocasiae]